MPRLERFTTGEASWERLVEIRRLCDSAFDGDFFEQDWEHALGGWHVVVIDGGAVIDDPLHGERILPDVVAHDRGRAAGWFQQTAQHLDGGGFACAVRSQEREQLAVLDVQIDAVHRREFTESPGNAGV